MGLSGRESIILNIIALKAIHNATSTPLGIPTSTIVA